MSRALLISANEALRVTDLADAGARYVDVLRRSSLTMWSGVSPTTNAVPRRDIPQYDHYRLLGRTSSGLFIYEEYEA